MSVVPKIDFVSPTEVLIHTVSDEAIKITGDALSKVGGVRNVDELNNVIDGYIKYGFQTVKIHISFIERESGKTNIVIQGSSDDVLGVAARNAISRLIEMIRNMDNQGYQPDKLGMSPMTLFAIVVGFSFFIGFIISKL